jgi:hypothetical protein
MVMNSHLQEMKTMIYYGKENLNIADLVCLMITQELIKHTVVNPEIQALHGERLMLTVPLVVFGLFRYCYQVQLGKGEDVSKDLLKDPWILGAMGAWVLLFLSTKLF